MYEFDKTNFLTACNNHSLDMLYGRTTKDRSQSRDELLALVKDLADSYSKALESLNAIELAKSWGSESGETEDKENRPEPRAVCKFTYETMSARCKHSLTRGCYYICIKPEVERVKEHYERWKKEKFERYYEQS